MRAKKRLLQVMLTALVFTFVLAACAGNADDGQTGGTATNKNDSNALKPLHFTYYGNYDWFSPTDGWDKYPVRKWLKEEKGVSWEDIGANGNAATKMNTMILSDELPDVIMMDRGPGVEKLAKEGRLVALDEYIDKYPNVKKLVGEKTLNMIRSEDGHIYMLPHWFLPTTYVGGNGGNGYVVNKKIYKELGSPKLETFTDLENYLNMVKENYPDIIPLEMTINTDGNITAQNIFYSGFAEGGIPMFTKTSEVLGVPQDNTIQPLFDDPAYHESIRFLSKLFRDKLVSQDAMTQKADQIQEKLNNGRVAVFVGFGLQGGVDQADSILKAKDPEAGYEAIWPLHKEGLDKNKIYPNEYSSLGWNAVVITKNAEEPERIFEYLDWSITDEALRIFNYGPEGEYWDQLDKNGAPIPNEKFKQTSIDEINKLQFSNAILLGNAGQDALQQARELQRPEEERAWGTMASYNVFFKTGRDATEFTNMNPAPETEEGIVQQKIKDILTQAHAAALFAKSDEEVSAVIAKAKADAEKADYQRLLDWKTAKWQENLNKITGQ